jgi:hypothetical protein
VLTALLLAATLSIPTNVNEWRAAPSDDVALNLVQDGQAMRMDFDFRGHGGWAAAQHKVDIALPDNYRFTFRLKGQTPPNTLEIKFIDGENVWWVRRGSWEFPRDWTNVVVDKRQIEFAWGPSTTKVLEHVGAIEITVTAATGGKGSVWVDRISFDELPPDTSMPLVRASSAQPGQTPDRAMDGRADTMWRSASGGNQSLTIDMREAREVGGVVVQWNANDFARDYTVSTSLDDKEWTPVRTVRNGNGGRDYLRTPATTRYLRLDLTGGSDSYAISEVTVQPPKFGEKWIAVYQQMARDSLRGRYPRGFAGEFGYWTMFGVDRDEGNKPLLTEDGAIETPAGFTIEPFLRMDGRTITWADVSTTQSLERNALPIPSTTWHHDKFTLEVAPFGSGTPQNPIAYSRYRLKNTSTHVEHAQFVLAVRPLRATPPWHELNIADLTAPISSLAWHGSDLTVNGSSHVVALTGPSAVALASYDEGDASELIDRVTGRASDANPHSIEDPERHASAILLWNVTLNPGEQKDFAIASPLHTGATNAAALAGSDIETERRAAIAYWSRVADHIQIDIPAARDLVDTARINLAYDLLGRDGAALRGGPRNYDRSWIRDGALTSAALLRFGFQNDVRDYLRWFAQYQFKDGKIPCCVDSRGADPVPEHDSHGEFIYGVTEYTRLTGDRSLATELWPNVEKAANYIDTLRRQRLTPEYKGTEFYGILPPSISHEGYSAKPMHSFWDDFWALRGLRDVTWLASQLGKGDAAKRFAKVRDEFTRDFHASIEKTMSTHHIDYIAGCADLGDFDATSTTIGLEPGGDLPYLPQRALAATFERAWQDALSRMEGRRAWDIYTPYEVRQVGSFVRLGAPDRAHALLDFILDDRRPSGWKQWPEAVGSDYRLAMYMGDIPHLWVGSDYVRSLIDMLAYEQDDTLVLGAGVQTAWLDEGVSLRALHTEFGVLDFDAKRIGGSVVVHVAGVKAPKGGIRVALPGFKEEIVRAVPAEITLKAR